MEPNLKMVLDEIRKSKEDLNRRFDEHNAEWNRRFTDLDRARADRAAVVDQRFAALESSCAEISNDIGNRVATLEATRVAEIHDERDDRVAALETAAADLGSWRPEVEGIVDDLKAEVKRLTQEYKASSSQAPYLSLGGSPPPTAARPTTGAPAVSPKGPGSALLNRDVGFGSPATFSNIPVTGKPPDPPPLPQLSFPASSSAIPRPTPTLPYRPPLQLTIPPRPPYSQPNSQAASPNLQHQPSHYPNHPQIYHTPIHQPPPHHQNHLGRIPKLPFNTFNGEHPRLWRTNCEKYFTMNFVDPSMWVSIASMYLEGLAACWYESIDNTPATASWTAFCQALHIRFDRDQHESLIRQMFQIKQTTTVQDYVDRFTKLLDQLKAYNASTEPLFYTQRFIDGLKPELKAIILVVKPQSLDAAISMALAQEEAAAALPARAASRSDWAPTSKFQSRTALPLPPPPRPDKPPVPPTAAGNMASTSTNAKLSAVKAYRQAMGLCYTCGEKWSKDHKCGPHVQLHLVQELWRAHQDEDQDESPPSPPPTEPAAHVYLAISDAAVAGSSVPGTPVPDTVQFSGHIGGVPVRVLLDSGSSASFISATVAAQLPHAHRQHSDCRV